METSKKKAARLSGSMIVRDRQKSRRAFVINVPVNGDQGKGDQVHGDKSLADQGNLNEQENKEQGARTASPDTSSQRAIASKIPVPPRNGGTGMIEPIAAHHAATQARPPTGSMDETSARDEVVIPRAAGLSPAPLSPSNAAMGQVMPSSTSATALQGEEERLASVQQLVQSLRSGELSQAEAVFTELAGLPTAAALQILYGQDAQNLAVACRALGMEQLQFVSVYIMSRKLGRAQESLDPNELAQLVADFERTDKVKAERVMKEWRSQLTGGREDSTHYH